MQSRDFCYWLQGYFEIAENIDPVSKGTRPKDVELTQNQVDVIRAHLNLVFKHEIDVSNLKDKTDKEKLEYQAIHDGAKSGSVVDSFQVTYNC